MTPDKFDDALSDIHTLQAVAARLTEALDNASTCKKDEDLRTNISDAIAEASTILRDLQEIEAYTK